MEQRRILANEADGATQAFLGDIADVMPIYADGALLHVEHAQGEVDQRRLARAGAADEADLFAGADGKAEVIDDAALLAAPVVEADLVVDDPAIADGQGLSLGR